MHAPVADSPNNWVQVGKTDDAKYVAEVGKETFHVEITVSLVNGKILHAALDNLVVAQKLQCVDAALATCGDPVDDLIRRQIELNLEAHPGKQEP
jgi:hypothetical protein